MVVFVVFGEGGKNNRTINESVAKAAKRTLLYKYNSGESVIEIPAIYRGDATLEVPSPHSSN